MFQSSEFVVFICLFLGAKTTTEQILPPQNLSLHWINEFTPELTWEPPPHSMANCYYDGKIKMNHKEALKLEPIKSKSTSFSDGPLSMEGGLLSYSLETVCHGNRSEPAVLNISNPDLVKSPDFYITTAKRGHCSWSPVRTTPELRFFYLLNDQNSEEPSTEILQECSSYTYTDGVKSGCDLNATTEMSIMMLFNATVNNKVVRNTFNRKKLKVKPAAPEWTVKKNKSNFTISWTPPDMLGLNSWTFTINYTECEKEEQRSVKGSSHVLLRTPSCQYCMKIQAKSKYGDSPPSDEKCFDPDPSSFSVYIVIVALLVTLASIFIVCLLRNKKHIFPKIPVPSNFFKDVLENNNESFFRKLYVPTEEQENCTVTVVKDAQTIKPDC
ncbi:interleukin-13 receptor subunit alpha-1 [Poeciliopsis prolifica]|uniref:interleukin-13 receptor subunit alpha-1 n=1 Tax=Poeciliopsis prolifica TaxID=188132 RepID=UPI0024146791|nr:interleukin-13 receptor subunit alpha-1 [Poeciliopsis prolifica]